MSPFPLLLSSRGSWCSGFCLNKPQKFLARKKSFLRVSKPNHLQSEVIVRRNQKKRNNWNILPYYSWGEMDINLDLTIYRLPRRRVERGCTKPRWGSGSKELVLAIGIAVCKSEIVPEFCWRMDTWDSGEWQLRRQNGILHTIRLEDFREKIKGVRPGKSFVRRTFLIGESKFWIKKGAADESMRIFLRNDSAWVVKVSCVLTVKSHKEDLGEHYYQVGRDGDAPELVISHSELQSDQLLGDDGSFT